MSNEEATPLTTAREKAAVLHRELDELAEKWALAERQLKTIELEESLHAAEREAKDPEQVEALKTQLTHQRVTLPPDPDTVRKEGEIVTDIPWQNGETVHWAYVWSLCTKNWVQMKTSHYEPHRVCGAIGWNWIHIGKCYGGDFQLMRYQNRLFWVRK